VIRSGESDVFSAARDPSGMPSRYFDVSIPCASGEKPMQPTPSSPSVSSSSGSIQRFSSEYEGWWMSSGVPSRSRIAYASRVFSGEYDEMPAYSALPERTALSSAPSVSSSGVSGSKRCE
jgi:hypothetical protein